jgi:hypothetical protein
MNINATIIDQQVRGFVERNKAALNAHLNSSLKDDYARSVSFVAFCAKTALGLSEQEAIELITDGGNDMGVDAIDVSALRDNEFVVTLFQGKYNHSNLDGTRAFPLDGVAKAILAVQVLFDPQQQIDPNSRLAEAVEEVRSLILDGAIPRVKFILCNNGARWGSEAQTLLDAASRQLGDRVSFDHFNHESAIQLLQNLQPVDDFIQFSGKALVEDINYARVLIGRVHVSEIARLMDVHGDKLLEKNIRRYLGIYGNRVNSGIMSTLTNPNDSQNFYFYNNGITLLCDRFDFNSLQAENHKVRTTGLQIINGGQTSHTLLNAFNEYRHHLLVPHNPFNGQTFVLVRLYQIPADSPLKPSMITYATNSQNPVDLRDLRSNDEVQRRLEESMRLLGYEYRRQRSDAAPKPNEISVPTAAEAVLSVWRRKPQQAKFREGEHFGKLYDAIFTPSLSAAQVIIAVLLFRFAENRRKRPAEDSPRFVAYASCFISMLMGEQLLAELKIAPEKLDHLRFAEAKALFDSDGPRLYQDAITRIQAALRSLYGAEDSTISLQRLAATFRRGDLLQELAKTSAHPPSR